MSTKKNRSAEGPVDVGSRLELFVDDFLVERLRGAALTLHAPTPREVALSLTRSCEGHTAAYFTVFRDDDRVRLYYRGSHFNWKTRQSTHEFTCYAESSDGIHWTRPNLGRFAHRGTKRNNIVWAGAGCHNFSPFLDANPDAAADCRYKALGSIKEGLVAFGSPDGFRWRLLRPAMP